MELSEYFSSLGAVFEEARVLRFTDSAKEFEYLEDAVLCPLANGQIRITGDDRLDFVHGQVTNQVKNLALNSFSENLLLNHKGHALVDLRVFRRTDDLYLTIEDSSEFCLVRFKKHIIFDKVVLEDLSNKLMTFTVQGKNAKKHLEAALASPMPKAGEFIELNFENAKILVNPAQRTVYGGYDINLCISDAIRVFKKLLAAGIKPSGEEALEFSRVEAKIPIAIKDAGPGVLPQEAGLEPKLSYNKGCYLGQEIIARIHARSSLPRSLKRLRLEAMPAKKRADILLAAKKIGVLGTVVKHPKLGLIALAVIKDNIETTEFDIGGVKASL